MVGNSTTPICQYSMSTFYCLQNISGEVSSFHVWIFFVDNFQESLVLVLILYDQSFKMSQIHQIYLRKKHIPHFQHKIQQLEAKRGKCEKEKYLEQENNHLHCHPRYEQPAGTSGTSGNKEEICQHRILECENSFLS